MELQIVAAVASVVNVFLVLWIALITKRYADATEKILTATRESLETLRTSSYGVAYTWAANLLSSEHQIVIRRKVFDDLPKYNGLLKDMPRELRDALEEVCRTYDLVGIAGHNEMLPHQIIAKEWGNSIIRLHELCEPYLRELRSERGQMFWNNFTELYTEAKKVWH